MSENLNRPKPLEPQQPKSQKTNDAPVGPIDNRSDKVKVYTIKRVQWVQHELLYPQMPALLGIIEDLGKEFNAIFDQDDASFLGIAQALYQKQIVPRVFALILKPNNPNPIRTVINRFWMWRYRLTPANIVEQMTTTQWMEILRDFFVASSKQIGSLLPFATVSGSMNSKSGSPSSEQSWTIPIFQALQTISALRKGSIISPAEAAGNTNSSQIN